MRMIYFVSDPQAFRQEVVEQMKTTIREVQRIFADQIRAHVPTIMSDSEREPSVLRGMHKMNPWFISYMVPEVLTTIGVPLDVLNRTSILFNIRAHKNVYFIVLGNEEDIQLRNVLGLGLQYITPPDLT